MPLKTNSIILKEQNAMRKDIHIGNIIKEKFDKSGLSISQFAQMINRTRTTIYDIFNRKSIDIDLLIQISEVLQFNFLEEVYMKNGSGKAGGKKEEEAHYIVGTVVTEDQLKNIDTQGKEVILIKKVIIRQPE